MILRQNIPFFFFFFHIWAKFRTQKSPGVWLQNENQIYKSGKFTSFFFPHLWRLKTSKTISFSNFNLNFTFWRNLTRKKKNGCLGATSCGAHRKTSITRAPVVVNSQNWLVVRRIQSWSRVSSSSFRELGSDAFIKIVESWIV